MSETDQLPLIMEAEQAAKEVAIEWIRAALRETFLQGLKSVWKVSSNYETETEDFTIQVSSAGFRSCISLVEDLSHDWRDDLIKAGHTRTSGWVTEVFLQGKQHLWAKSVSMQAELAATPSIVNNNQKEISPAEEDSDETSRPNEIPYCKLRRLCRKIRIDDEFPGNSLELLQEMGRNGESYWPLDWKLIEDAVEMERPKRNTQKRKIVKDVDHPEMLPPPAKKPKVETTARPAVDRSCLIISSDALSNEEKERICSDFVHKEPSDSDCKNPPLTLFGAIQKVGHINYSKRHRSHWTEKRANREINAAVAERLYPNKMESNAKVRSYRSKVLKTKSRYAESDHFFDFDMGWSLLEVRDPDDDSQKRLCAFSSIEIRLEDKSHDAV